MGSQYNRPFVDLNELKQNLYDYLLIKLFLFKQKNIEFNITIKLDGKKERISNQDVEELKQKTFEIASDVFDVKYTFNLYYLFKRDGKNSKKIYYCSNYRSTKIIDDDSLGFSCSLPDKSSFVMLLTSNYLDDKDNDGRDDFTKLSNLRQATLDTPILISDINRETKKMMNEIIKEEYPELINYNNLEIQKAITKAPYLVDFIKADDDVVKSEKALITSANKKFNEAKTSTKIKFEKILKDRKIDTKEFDETLSSVTDIAVAELGEYILYRDNIIKGLELAIKDSAKKEEYIHNIFMLKNTVDDGKNDKHLLSNLWLLDDKFMSYVQAFSDKSIKNISEEDEKSKMIDISGILHRPDLTLFYSNSSNGKKDVVMIELKGANANKEEKKKAVTELPDDISILRDAMGEKVNVVWGYIITSIDEFLLRTLNTQDFRMLFATNGESKMYYKYYGNINAHIYVIDLQTICDDAFARNKTFLDILKKRADN